VADIIVPQHPSHQGTRGTGNNLSRGIQGNKHNTEPINQSLLSSSKNVCNKKSRPSS
jgi:hypothetical protein